MALARTIAFANWKGGIGKTSLTANVGAVAAAGGLKTLIVELDPQGNIRRNLGMSKGDAEDLAIALQFGKAVPVVTAVRENLDVVQGGPALSQSAHLFANPAATGGRTLSDALTTSLSPVVEPYDLVLIDTPPVDMTIAQAAFDVAAAVVIPADTDITTSDGLEETAKMFVNAKNGRNPQIHLAGVVMFRVAEKATAQRSEAAAFIGSLIGSHAPVFSTTIPDAGTSFKTDRKLGHTARELIAAAKAQKTAALKALRTGESVPTDVKTSIATATKIAEAYESFTNELVTRLAEIEGE